MDSIFIGLAHLPTLVIYGIVGGICGALGVLVGDLLKRSWSSAPRLMPVILLAASTPISRQVVIPQINAHAQPEIATRQLEQASPLFRAIFHYHPEAREEARSGFRTILSGDRSEMQLRSQRLGSRISNRYFSMHLPTASDEAISRLIAVDNKIQMTLRANPQACIRFYSGSVNPGDVPQTLMMEELEAKAKIIETSAQAPTHANPITSRAMAGMIVAAYKRDNVPVAEIAKLADLKSLSPADACSVIVHFSSALAGLGPEKGPQVYRAILRVGI